MALLLSQLGYNVAFFSATLQLSSSFRNVRNGSLSAGYDGNLLGGFFHPKLVPWAIRSDRMARGTRYQRDTNGHSDWLSVPAPSLGWNAPTDRLARASGHWTTDTNSDNAWLYAAQPVVEGFDPALYPGIAALVGAWTPSASRIQTAYYLALTDLSWVHDVIPLTDPVPGADFIYLRPIAPIMSARRRNKKRRR